MRRSISFDPGPDERTIRKMKPWWRKAGEWLSDFHKFVLTLLSISAASVAIHVYLGGLIVTDRQLKSSVEEAVTKAFSTVKGDLDTIKDNTNGLPLWRGEMNRKADGFEVRITVTEAGLRNANDRMDRYFTTRAR